MISDQQNGLPFHVAEWGRYVTYYAVYGQRLLAMFKRPLSNSPLTAIEYISNLIF